MGDYFQITYSLKNAEGKNFSLPRLNNFHVQGPSTGFRQYNFNGKVSSEQNFIYTLEPKKEGTFTIPAATIKWNGRKLKSNKLTIKVTKGRKKTATQNLNSNLGVALVAELTKDEVYVGEQVLLDFTIYTRHNIESYKIERSPDFKGVFTEDVQDLGKRTANKKLNGVLYTTKLVRRMLLSPQQEGYIEIDPMTMRIAVDKGVFSSVMPFYNENVNASIYNNTAFTNLDSALKLLDGDAKTIIKNLNNDAAYKYAKPMIDTFFSTINVAYNKKNEPIVALQKRYMKALMETLPEARYFPDANSTLRVSYGQVRGYSPRDAVYYNPVSYLDGVIEKYIPGDYEFDVPQKLRDLYEAKDYGQYADSNGKVPVCFLGTNHTTGGNSGSPAIDAHGNLVGLNFDRVWEGTMSDMNYDPEICRNIMVDLRYVLFIIDKYAGAKHLIDEMKLVHPKK